MRYTPQELAQIWHCNPDFLGDQESITEIVYDTRRMHRSDQSLFIALRGTRNGHDFIQTAYQLGVRYFLIEASELSAFQDLKEACIFAVSDPLKSLQTLAAHHRKSLHLPVIGITGSNGKTVVKEWLYELLKTDFYIHKSPRSFNSQLGVALSVLGIERHHQLAIIEAGISQMGDMAALQAMIQPNLVVLTHLGDAHEEGFPSAGAKAAEKMQLVQGADVVVFPKDQEIWKEAAQNWRRAQPLTKFVSWGKSENSSYTISKIDKTTQPTEVHFKYRSMEHVLKLPFKDDASIANAMTCFTVLTALERWDPEHLEAFMELHPIENRLSIEKGRRQTIIVNDAYSHDIESLRVALGVLTEQSAGKTRTVILTPMAHGKGTEILESALSEAGIDRVIWVGVNQLPPEKTYKQEFFSTTEALLESPLLGEISQTALLIKGARVHRLERVAMRLKEQLHHTVMEINLDAVRHNYQFFRSRIDANVKVMVMVKAAAYGSGRYEVARVLESQGADYFGVAYADEAVALRAAGLKAPIMVMNTDGKGLEQSLQHDLEPVIYNVKSLEELIGMAKGAEMGIHVELDTGMHRLGFSVDTNWTFLEKLPPNIKIKTVFTHLSASENAEMDFFTKAQLEHLQGVKALLEKRMGYGIWAHGLNSSGIVRFPEYQMDMVRLGIGLYGLETPWDGDLKSVAALYTTITQIHQVEAGAGIGYGQLDAADHPRRIATIAVGYADGLLRKFGRGNWGAWIHGEVAPFVGNICMDMAMLDVTDIACGEGDRVEIFGSNHSIKEMARRGETISYEILTTISQRVPRLFVGEF